MRGLASPLLRTNAWTRGLARTVLIVAIVAAYSQTLSVPFHFDDGSSIETNLSIRKLGLGALAPPSDATTGGRPIANLSFALNFAFGGTSVRGYHVVNLLIHVLAALTLFGIVRRSVQPAPVPPETGLSPLARPPNFIAFGSAVIWALHPLQTSSVTYISQRTESLMALFYLLTLYGFVRGAATQSSRSWLILSVAACAAGMATKESMVTAPVLVLLYDRIFVAGAFVAAWGQRRLYYSALAATWLFLALMLTTGLDQRHVGFGLGVTWWEYALTECHAVLLYLRLALWPHPLVFDHGPAFARSFVSVLPQLTLLTLAVGTVVWGFRRWPRAAFLGAAFFLILAPTSSVVPVALQPIAENRTYLPLAGIVILGVVALHRLLSHHARVSIALCATALGIATFARNRMYQDPLQLWADTIAKRPDSPRALENYGATLCRLGRFAEALPYCEKSIQLNPRSADAYSKIGDVYFNLARLPEATANYVRALELNPRLQNTRVNLGVIFFQGARTDDALAQFERVLQLNPHHADAHLNLALALAQLGRRDEARPHYIEALKTKHDQAPVHLNYANLLLTIGLTEDAIAHYEKALQLDPTLAIAHVGWATACLQSDRTDEAARHCEEALRLAPNLAAAHFNHGVVLFRLGQVNAAIARLEHALTLNPAYAEARQSLANLRAAYPNASFGPLPKAP